IAAAIEAVEPANRVRLLEPDQAKQEGLWRRVPDDVKSAYLRGVAGLRRHPEVSCHPEIAYTALHGVGGPWFEAAISEAKLSGVQVVREQHTPDPAFPTVPFPNPEEPGAMDLTRDLAERIGADVAFATDPDADRLAVMVRNGQGKLQQLTGNEVGLLLGYYLLTQGPSSASPPLVVSTIVSSPPLGEIAPQPGAPYDEAPTGFKRIRKPTVE